MITFHKKIVLDENGNPTDVIIPYKKFLELKKILGLDLEKEVKEHLRQVCDERENFKDELYVELDVI